MELPNTILLETSYGSRLQLERAAQTKSPTGASQGYKVSHTRHTGRNQLVNLSQVHQNRSPGLSLQTDQPEMFPVVLRSGVLAQSQVTKVIMLSVGYKAK